MCVYMCVYVCVYMCMNKGVPKPNNNKHMCGYTSVCVVCVYVYVCVCKSKGVPKPNHNAQYREENRNKKSASSTAALQHSEPD